jgi:hypothetical protein
MKCNLPLEEIPLTSSYLFGVMKEMNSKQKISPMLKPILKVTLMMLSTILIGSNLENTEKTSVD